MGLSTEAKPLAVHHPHSTIPNPLTSSQTSVLRSLELLSRASDLVIGRTIKLGCAQRSYLSEEAYLGAKY